MKFSEIKEKLENGVKWSDLGLNLNEYVPIGQKYGVVEQVFDNVIINKNGFYTISRLDYDVNLCALICGLYADIEYENEFTNVMLDVFLKYKFYSWLRSKTDCYDFESIYKTAILDEVRRLNARTPDIDLNELQKIVDEFKNINPDTLKLINIDGANSIKKIAEEMVKNDSSNKSAAINSDNK
jgi:hypothetical protein